VVGRVGERLLAALRDYAGPRPRLNAVMFDFNGSVLWEGESPKEAAA
jgi:hypothetical protein